MAIIGESLSLNLQSLLLFGMSDPHKNQENKQYNHNLQIDDPSRFLSLSPNASVSQGRERQENGGRSEEFSNDQEYFPDAVEEEENKPDDIELYEAESINLQDIEDEEDKAEKSIVSASKKEFLELPMLPKQSNKLLVTDQEKISKIVQKKKRKGRKKANDSQQEEYSGEYGPTRKKNKVKENKRGGKRNQTTRSRGKPRGRGSHASKVSEVKKEYVYSDDYEKIHQRLRNIPSKKNQTIVQPPSYILAPFNSSWRIAEENQIDWDSENASIWSESANRRANYADEIISLIERKPENIVALIAALPPLFYTTLN